MLVVGIIRQMALGIEHLGYVSSRATPRTTDGLRHQRHSRVTGHSSNIADRIKVLEVDHVGHGRFELGERWVVEARLIVVRPGSLASEGCGRAPAITCTE